MTVKQSESKQIPTHQSGSGVVGKHTAGLFTVHHSGKPGAYRAIIKRDGVVVWTSPDTYWNRDETTSAHLGARSVASSIVHILTSTEEQMDVLRRWYEKSCHSQRNYLLFKSNCKIADEIRASIALAKP